MKIDDIIPYKHNARHNEKAVPVVAESIKTFGFKGAIVLRSHDDPTIVNGHTRVAACKYLGWTEFPDEYIVYADDLTDDEVRALRLADNRTGEVATWNKALLKYEMKSIKGIDMTRFKFDFKSKKDDFQFGQERLKTDDAYNLPQMYEYGTYLDAVGEWGIPRLEAVDFVPTDLMPFNYVKSYKGDRSRVGVHFFKDDYQFERCWKNPAKYIEVLKEHECVIMPDFSLYTDMPLAIQVYNAYRNAFCARVWQKGGVNVIPCLLWSTQSSFKFCFDSIPRGSTVCVSTVGVMTSKHDLALWRNGMREALRVCKPARVLLYGTAPDFDFGDVEVVEYKQSVFHNDGVIED